MTTTLVAPRAILFDWDNTLVDTWPLIHKALNMTLRYMEHPEWSLERVRAEVAQSMRDSFPAMFGDRWQDAAKFYQDSYRSIHLDELRPLLGAAEMLAAIPDHVFTGVVSNKQGVTLRKEIPQLGWAEYFDVAVGSTDAPRDKPHADPALLALKDSGIAPGPDVWFVGDTDADLGCAKNAGFSAILYGDHLTDGKTYDGYPFAAQVKDQSELMALIVGACAAARPLPA